MRLLYEKPAADHDSLLFLFLCLCLCRCRRACCLAPRWQTPRRWRSGFRKNQRSSTGAGPRSQSSEVCSSERETRRASSAWSCPRQTLPLGEEGVVAAIAVSRFLPSIPSVHRQRRPALLGVFAPVVHHLPKFTSRVFCPWVMYPLPRAFRSRVCSCCCCHQLMNVNRGPTY